MVMSWIIKYKFCPKVYIRVMDQAARQTLLPKTEIQDFDDSVMGFDSPGSWAIMPESPVRYL